MDRSTPTRECVITTYTTKHSANPRLSSTAYWIAFGPHGPRAEPPAGEGRKVALYTTVAVGVSFIIFASMRMFANPAPHTMTREWQEASNEYLKVRSYPSTSHSCDAQPKLTHDYRAKDPTPSPVSRPRATRARARSSRLPRELNRSGGFTLLLERLDAPHGRRRSMYKTGTRWEEDVGGLSRWRCGADGGGFGLVYILYNDDNATPFLFESQTGHPPTSERDAPAPWTVNDMLSTYCCSCTSSFGAESTNHEAD